MNIALYILATFLETGLGIHIFAQALPKRECMGKAGRKRVEELYDWEKNVDTMEKLYEEVRVKKE